MYKRQLRTRALAALLCAALDEVRQENALTGVQHAGALWTVEFVRGERQQVDVLRLDVNGQMPRGLHGVGVEQLSLIHILSAPLFALSLIVQPPYYDYCNKYITNRNISQADSRKLFKGHENGAATFSCYCSTLIQNSRVRCSQFVLLLLYRT